MTHTSPSLDQLRAYQQLGVQFLATRDAALLADEMGLGKTVQAIMALELRLRSAEVRSALVVSPAAVCPTWEAELRKWSPGLASRRVTGDQQDRFATYKLPVPVLIASYEQVRADAIWFDAKTHFDIVVLDEAQRIKNADSATALACRVLPRQSSWALSGTPVENRPSDLVSIFGFVRPRLLRRGMSRGELHQLIQPYFLRRRKDEVLSELPPIVIDDVPIELMGEQRAAYDELWENRLDVSRTLHSGGPMTSAFQFINQLKQVCNFHEASQESAKLDWLNVYSESLSGPNDKVLVFSQYVQTLNRIRERITSVPTHMYHGKISSKERESSLQSFHNKNGPRMLLISLRAGGVGLNIPSASAVVMFDRWWNPAVEDQAIQRAHRFGRDRPLFVSRLCVMDTIEERIQKLLESKRSIFREYVEEAEDAIETLLSRSDLLRLFGLTLTQELKE
jgi:SNF2 family DNA or RNA helicase